MVAAAIADCTDGWRWLFGQPHTLKRGSLRADTLAVQIFTDVSGKKSYKELGAIE